MNEVARRPLWLALALSLLLHLVVLTAPGWGWSLLAEEADDPPLAATLAVAPQPPAPAPAVPPPRPRPAAAQAPIAVPDALAMPAQEEVSPGEMALAESAPLPVPETPPTVEEASPISPLVPLPDAVPPAPTFAQEWPRTGRIVYQVTRGEGGLIVGEAVHRWHHDGAAYELQAVTETIGLAALFRPARVTQESRGIFAPGGLQPVAFRTERDGKPKDSVRFDAEQGRVIFGRGDSAAFVAGAQDLLSLFHALSVLRGDGVRYALTVATARKLSRYEVTVVGTETLATALGEFKARHIRIAGPAVEDATEIWYDVATQLPMKIRHRDRKGEIYDQVATHVEVNKSSREPQ